jgi:hypothetical protein
MVVHNSIVIHIEGVIVGKLTLVLVDLGGTHNLMSEVFATSLGHPIRTINPSWILPPNGQVHNTNIFMKDVLVRFPKLETYTNFQVWLGSIYDVI